MLYQELKNFLVNAWAAPRNPAPPGRVEYPMTNRQYAELLATAGETAEGHYRRALRKAARKALAWPVAVETLRDQGRPLTELEGIGPVLARRLMEWTSPPDPPPPLRADFLSLDEANEILRAHPDWIPRGDLHCHTDWSDGTEDVAAMAQAAADTGYEYLAITDHAGGLRIANGLPPERLRQQWEHMRTLETPVTLLRSVELNLDPEGRPDLPPDLLDEADLLIGAFHSALRRTDDQTERFLKALEHVDVLAHPQGRIYNHRFGLSADWDRVCARAAQLDVALEIDCYPSRQDASRPILEAAREHGTRISLGSDAHSSRQLGFLAFGLAWAARARIPRERIVNFLPIEDLKQWLAKRRTGSVESE